MGDQPQQSDVSSLIRQARKAAGLSQADVASRLGVTQTCISYWESGQRSIHACDLPRLAGVLGVETAALVPPAEDPALAWEVWLNA